MKWQNGGLFSFFHELSGRADSPGAGFGCDLHLSCPGERGGAHRMSDAVLCLEKLTVRYGDFVAVDGLDLQLNRGELFGLLGPNGAGKSSTLRVLIGQRPPTAGRVTLAGLDVVRDWQKVKTLFGYVPDRENHFE